MTLPVSLQAVIDELDTVGDKFHPYLNQHTGELVTLSLEEIHAAEHGDDLDGYPDWQPVDDSESRTSPVFGGVSAAAHPI